MRYIVAGRGFGVRCKRNLEKTRNETDMFGGLLEATSVKRNLLHSAG
jgi:hypothetical protein